MNWVDNKSGDFIVASNRVGAFRIYNVGQKESKSMAKVGVAGIKNFVSIKSNPFLFLVAFEKGSIGVYDLEKRRMEF